jgi:hypothetical protein
MMEIRYSFGNSKAVTVWHCCYEDADTDRYRQSSTVVAAVALTMILILFWGLPSSKMTKNNTDFGGDDDGNDG